MPTELQIIDGLERLREQFIAENPAYPLNDPPAADPGVPAWLESGEGSDGGAAARVVAAWLHAQDGRGTGAGARQRRVRMMTRMILGWNEKPDGAPSTTGASPVLAAAVDSLDPRDRALLARADGFPERLERARRERLWPLIEPAPDRTAAEEARAWSRLLPGLTGLRAWRFLERLGRPVIAPERPVRRLLWRLGLLEELPGGNHGEQQAHSILEQIGRLTGLPLPSLGVLLRWLTSGDRDLAGGRWCDVRPRCAACPLRPACLWARFHPESAEEGPDSDDKRESAARRSLEPLRRQIAAGKQDALHELELLAVLLQGGARGQDAYALAEMLLQRLGGLKGLDSATVAQLAQVRGMSEARGAQLKAALELGRRLAAQALRSGDPITASEDVWRAYRSRFRHLPQEHFVVLLLDAKNRVIHDHIVSKGTLTGSLAHPREVFQEAIRHAAAGVILMHNHPSGDPQPSRDDRAVTIRLKDSGEILGIKVLDHIILGADDYFSFKDEDLL